MEIYLAQEDENTPGLWYSRVGGEAVDGKIKLSEAITMNLPPDMTPHDWLIQNPNEAQALIDNGEYHEAYADRYKAKLMLEAIQGELEWLNEIIPEITASDSKGLRQIVTRMARQNRGMLRAWRYILKHFNTLR